jgi:hypothetical protein
LDSNLSCSYLSDHLELLLLAYFEVLGHHHDLALDRILEIAGPISVLDR